MPIDPIYTAVATSTGGRHGHVASDDGVLDVDLVRPAEMGGPAGPPEGTNPEQLFAAGYSACFHASLVYAAGLRGLELEDSRVTARIGIGRADGGLGLTATLHVELPDVAQSTAEALVAKAHELCPYSRATRGNMDVEIELLVTSSS